MSKDKMYTVHNVYMAKMYQPNMYTYIYIYIMHNSKMSKLSFFDYLLITRLTN